MGMLLSGLLMTVGMPDLSDHGQASAVEGQ
jgi:hypothetical protein